MSPGDDVYGVGFVIIIMAGVLCFCVLWTVFMWMYLSDYCKCANIFLQTYDVPVFFLALAAHPPPPPLPLKLPSFYVYSRLARTDEKRRS